MPFLLKSLKVAVGCNVNVGCPVAFYHDKILPRLIKSAMSDKRIEPFRKKVLAGCRGRVLELGVGSGANFSCYPVHIDELVGIDPHPAFAVMAEEASKKLKFPFKFVQCSGESLPFQDQSFDCVVSTFTLCSVPDSQAVAREIRRVLKADGRLVFLEHGISPDSGTKFIQKSLNGLQRRLAGGCQLTKDHFADLKAAGLVNADSENFYLPKVPGFLGYIYCGTATSTD